ncbi:enoyl-CoA hydratase-related protein [Thalassobius sp. S69A]|uniref:enoyl-CoA hydratase-related protein n=1 Tax=unclassified Thalassovita TaxID=2619711 RepID=UPI000C0FF32D|nr:enoyl-CoA hydratase [Paracoccaceae bacterium]MBT25873.1 enoyl-CoA hydratase [Paracoccaceae bacterium]
MKDTAFSTVLTQTDGPVGIVQLNRPEALNALNQQITTELGLALDAFEADESIHVIVLTGNDRAFAAGADVKEIQHKTSSDVYEEDFITATWERAARCRKPMIAAVAGHAVGGGCELALMCDIIIAADSARFALPETRIGVIPGAGGTQRLTRIVGKAIAMDMILSGRTLSAQEALAHGLVSRISTPDSYLDDAIALAMNIAKSSRPILRLAKEAVNQAYETPLSAGIHLERRLLYATFATEDRLEGMTAFIEKRPPTFRHR